MCNIKEKQHTVQFLPRASRSRSLYVVVIVVIVAINALYNLYALSPDLVVKEGALSTNIFKIAQMAPFTNMSQFLVLNGIFLSTFSRSFSERYRVLCTAYAFFKSLF